MGRRIGVFDSGVGGLSVLNECRKLMPHENYIYLADKANMPYGTKPREEIIAAALGCAEALFSMNCKAVVVACNTATENAIDVMRKMFDGEIIVGLEPAVKPCLRELKAGEYGVALVTEATARSEKFRALVDGKNEIAVAPQPELAELIERGAGERELYEYVQNMLAPYRDAAAVALGCSHYSFISPLVSRFYGGKVRIYDGAAGAAARLKSILGETASDGCLPHGQVLYYSTVRS